MIKSAKPDNVRASFLSRYSKCAGKPNMITELDRLVELTGSMVRQSKGKMNSRAGCAI